MKNGDRTLVPTVLVGADLGHFLLHAMGGFWLFRLVLQPMYFGLGRPPTRVMAVVFAEGAVPQFGVWMAANAIRGAIEAPPPKGRQGRSEQRTTEKNRRVDAALRLLGSS